MAHRASGVMHVQDTTAFNATCARIRTFAFGLSGWDITRLIVPPRYGGIVHEREPARSAPSLPTSTMPDRSQGKSQAGQG